MQINGVVFSADLEEILIELQAQLHINGNDLLNKIQPTNDNIMVQCPYHNHGTERRPSAGIRKSDGLFNCLACHEVHTLQEVISHCFGHYDDMIGAFGWNWLLRNFATMQIEERKGISVDVSRDNFGKSDKKIIEYNYVSEEELDSYRYIHPYMYKRGLTDEVIELFDIGYDSNSDCITFPVRDIRGNTLFIARRSVKSKYFNYPQDAVKPLYGLYELYHLSEIDYDDFVAWENIFPKEVIICESMLDALSFWTVGKYAVALNGTGSFSQYQALRDLPCRELILCTDMDKAGMDARDKIRKNVKNKIISEYFLPKGCKDANDCTREQLLSLEKVY